MREHDINIRDFLRDQSGYRWLRIEEYAQRYSLPCRYFGHSPYGDQYDAACTSVNSSACDLALHEAIKSRSPDGTRAALALINSNLADFTSYSRDESGGKLNALHLAALTGNYQVAALIVKLAKERIYNGRSICVKKFHKDEPSAFYLANKAEQWDILRLFLETYPLAMRHALTPHPGGKLGYTLVRADSANTRAADQYIDEVLMRLASDYLDLRKEFHAHTDEEQRAIIETWGLPHSAASRFIQENIVANARHLAEIYSLNKTEEEKVFRIIADFFGRKLLPATPESLKKIFDLSAFESELRWIEAEVAKATSITTPFLTPLVTKLARLSSALRTRLSTTKNLTALEQLRRDRPFFLDRTRPFLSSALTRLPRLPSAFAILDTDNIEVFHRKITVLNCIAEKYDEALTQYNTSNALVISGHPLADALEAQRRIILTHINTELEAFDPEERLNAVAREIAVLRSLDRRIQALCSIARPCLSIPRSTDTRLESLEDTVHELEWLNTTSQAKRVTLQTLLTERNQYRFPANAKLNESFEAIAAKRAQLFEELHTRLENPNLDELTKIEAELTVLKDFDAALTTAAPELNYALALQKDDALNPALIDRWKMLDRLLKIADEELTQLKRLDGYSHFRFLTDASFRARRLAITTLQDNLKSPQDTASYVQLCVQVEILKAAQTPREEQHVSDESLSKKGSAAGDSTDLSKTRPSAPPASRAAAGAGGASTPHLLPPTAPRADPEAAAATGARAPLPSPLAPPLVIVGFRALTVMGTAMQLVPPSTAPGVSDCALPPLAESAEPAAVTYPPQSDTAAARDCDEPINVATSAATLTL